MSLSVIAAQCNRGLVPECPVIDTLFESSELSGMVLLKFYPTSPLSYLARRI